MNRTLYDWIIRAMTAGMVMGMLAMIQPWSLAWFRIGFMVLFYCTLGYIIFSHVTPGKEATADE